MNLAQIPTVLSDLCYLLCSPVAQADVKYQLFAECVPPGRSRAQTQGSGHWGHALNSMSTVGLVKSSRGRKRWSFEQDHTMEKRHSPFAPTPLQGMVGIRFKDKALHS